MRTSAVDIPCSLDILGGCRFSQEASGKDMKESISKEQCIWVRTSFYSTLSILFRSKSKAHL